MVRELRCDASTANNPYEKSVWKLTSCPAYATKSRRIISACERTVTVAECVNNLRIRRLYVFKKIRF